MFSVQYPDGEVVVAANDPDIVSCVGALDRSWEPVTTSACLQSANDLFHLDVINDYVSVVHVANTHEVSGVVGELDCVYSGVVDGVGAEAAAAEEVPNYSGRLEAHVVHATGSYVTAIWFKVQAGDVTSVTDEECLGAVAHVCFDYIGANGVNQVGSAGVDVEAAGGSNFSCLIDKVI